MVIINPCEEVLWARCVGKRVWQFPQGGMLEDEAPETALYRELHEELGLTSKDVEILGYTKSWLYYWLPVHMRRTYVKPLCIGQKQRWFLLRLIDAEAAIRFDSTSSPEFDRCRWVHYWYPLRRVISFKRHVYRRALEELVQLLPSAHLPISEEKICED